MILQVCIHFLEKTWEKIVADLVAIGVLGERVEAARLPTGSLVLLAKDCL